MTTYEYLVELATEVATERVIYVTTTQKTRTFITNLLVECPEWSDEKIANLATSTVETVKLLRSELKK